MSNFELSFKFRFQSTHPHGVRRKARPSHARRDPCFNPRTHTGCDAICRSAAAYRKSFNPRTHTGCDSYDHHRCHDGCCFNPRTHTGCDSGVCSYSRNAVMFQSTHPHGVRRLSHLKKCLMDMFQSTHPHGVRLLGPYLDYPFVACFNPRTHTGCDFNKTIVLQNSIVSIHAPTRGATRPKGSDLMLRGVSIHAPTRGATG